MTINKQLHSETETLDFGLKIAPQLKPGMIFYLYGQLGAGKTTLMRGILQGLGYAGRVKSPSYTIVEPYEINEFSIYHFDFYRIEGMEALQTLGLPDFFDGKSLCFIEWPEKAVDVLPPPDIAFKFEFTSLGRSLEITPKTKVGFDFIKSTPNLMV